MYEKISHKNIVNLPCLNNVATLPSEVCQKLCLQGILLLLLLYTCFISLVHNEVSTHITFVYCVYVVYSVQLTEVVIIFPSKKWVALTKSQLMCCVFVDYPASSIR